MTYVPMKWVRVQAACRDCRLVVDLPAHIAKDKVAVATLIHAEDKHYVDLDVLSRPERRPDESDRPGGTGLLHRHGAAPVRGRRVDGRACRGRCPIALSMQDLPVRPRP